MNGATNEVDRRGANSAPSALLLIAVILLLVACDFFSTAIWSGQRGIFEALTMAAVFGLLTAQLNLIGFWTALGPGRWMVRLPWALLAVVLTYVVQQSGADLFAERPVTQEERLILLAILLGAWLTISGVFASFRVATRRRLVRVGDSPANSAKFHLRHLIVGTGLCGVTLGLLHWFGYPIGEVWRIEWEQVLMIGALAMANFSIIIPALLTQFSSARQTTKCLGLVAYCPVVTGAEMFLLISMVGPPDEMVGMLVMLYFANLIQCFAIIASIRWFRAMGYDLRMFEGVRPKEESPASAGEVVDPWSEEEAETS